MTATEPHVSEPNGRTKPAGLIWLLGSRMRVHRRALVLVLGLVLAQSIANLYLPTLNADIINNGVLKGDTGYIWRTGGLMLGVTLGLSVLAIIAVYFASRIAMSVGRDLRSEIFTSVQHFSQREMNEFGAHSLITRNTNDVQQIQLFLVIALTMLVAAPVTAIGGVIMALYENATLSAVLLVIIPIMVAVIGSLLAVAIPLFRTVQKRIDLVNQVLRDQIAGVRVVRAFVQGRREEERFAGANAQLTQTTLSVTRIFAIAMPAIMAILNLSSVAVVWFGGHLIDSGSMPIGNLIAFLNYLMQILFAVMMATFMAILVPRAAASAERIGAVINTHSTVVEPLSPIIPSQQSGTVAFENVSFNYPGAEKPVLRNVSFELQPGTTTAIVGSTGSGKSTIANLLLRFFDVTGGTVLVNGVDVRQQPLETLWGSIGIVPQKGYLFSGTVASNLRMGRHSATDADMWHALEVAQARDFVSSMSQGLEEEISQGGTSVSGGQRQRLAIARALTKQASVYVLDDCFSALDAATDARVRASLKLEIRDATVVIISQRVSSILAADQILVLDDGEIVGRGRHTELLKTCETYREIVESQLLNHGNAA